MEDSTVSIQNCLGVLNEKKNILGMMPHPERASEAILGSEDGRIIFESIINYLKEKENEIFGRTGCKSKVIVEVKSPEPEPFNFDDFKRAWEDFEKSRT